MVLQPGNGSALPNSSLSQFARKLSTEMAVI